MYSIISDCDEGEFFFFFFNQGARGMESVLTKK